MLWQKFFFVKDLQSLVCARRAEEVEGAERTLPAYEPVLRTQQALFILVSYPRALIVTVSSDAAVGGYEGWGVYGASKSALGLIAKTFVSEAGRYQRTDCFRRSL